MKRVLSCFAALAMALVPVAAQAQSTFYGLDIIGGGGLFTMDQATATNFGGFMNPGITESNYTVFAMDLNSAETDIYAIDDTSSLFGTINPMTGEFTIIGPTNTGGADDLPLSSASGLTTDPSTGDVYVSSGTALYTLDPATGDTALVASFVAAGAEIPDAVLDIAFDNAGNLFAFDFDTIDPIDNGRLWSVDKTNGVSTFIGATGLDNVGFAQGMDFDPATNTLYSSVLTFDGTNIGGSYGSWNITGTTATFTELAGLQDTIASEYEMTIGMGITFVQNFLDRGALASFPVDLPSAYDVIFLPPVGTYSTMDFDGSGTTLYAIDRATAPSCIGTVDLATGAFTRTSVLSGDFATGGASVPIGITCDPSTGLMFMADIANLYTLDPETGATTLVGPFSGAPVMVEIASDSNGNLFGIDSAGSNLVSIDPTTAAISTVVSAPGLIGGFVQGMDFDPDDDLLYGAHYNQDLGGADAGEYGVWDLTAGTYTQITPLQSIDPDADGFLIQVAIQPTADIIDIVPTQATVSQGVIAGGTAADLAADDTVDFRVARNPNGLQPVVQFVAKSVSSIPNPSSMTFTINSSVFSRPNVTRRIEMFNYTTNTFDEIDSRASSRFGDRTDVITVTGTVSDYVEPGTGCVEARLRFTAAIGRAAFTANPDNIFWTIEN